MNPNLKPTFIVIPQAWVELDHDAHLIDQLSEKGCEQNAIQNCLPLKMYMGFGINGLLFHDNILK